MGSALRRALLLSASAAYFLRVVVTIFVFMKRRMGWGEVSVVALGIGVPQLCFAFLGGRQTAPVGLIEGLGIFLYAVGSCLNTGAEYQRHLWKKQTEHQGQLYTGGLFRYAMHINYFGDVVLFSGWALLTARWILFAVPVFMLLGFAFLHIPTLDRYLAERYGQAFQGYLARTKKLIPYFY
jgi:steroid 5-alpha reductase family enzyme